MWSLLAWFSGYFCLLGAWSSQPTDFNNYTDGSCLCPSNSTGGQCQPGYFCPRGSLEPTPCLDGYYCDVPGNAHPCVCVCACVCVCVWCVFVCVYVCVWLCVWFVYICVVCVYVCVYVCVFVCVVCVCVVVCMCVVCVCVHMCVVCVCLCVYVCV